MVGFREHTAIDGALQRGLRARCCMWMGCGVGGLRQRRRDMVRNIWHDAGGIGGAKNNQKTRVVGLNHGLVMFMGIVDAVWRGRWLQWAGATGRRFVDLSMELLQ